MAGASQEAFQRLLALAAEGGQAKVDALVALSQRTVFVPTWVPGDEAFRTIFSSSGVAALPIYTSQAELEEMSRRFGWATPDGRTPFREVGARGTFSHATAQNLLIIVNMGSDASIEIDQDEIRPLLTPAAKRESQGPFAATGRVSVSIAEAVNRRTPPPPRPGSSPGTVAAPTAPAIPDHQIPGARPSLAQDPPSQLMKLPQDPPSAMTRMPTQDEINAAAGVEITSLATQPSDELLDALEAVLRGYPEVEWACLASVARHPTPAVPAVGLRVDASFRSRIAEITAGLKTAGSTAGATLDVLLLDQRLHSHRARAVGKPFFPWRK